MSVIVANPSGLNLDMDQLVAERRSGEITDPEELVGLLVVLAVYLRHETTIVNDLLDEEQRLTPFQASVDLDDIYMRTVRRQDLPDAKGLLDALVGDTQKMVAQVIELEGRLGNTCCPKCASRMWHRPQAADARDYTKRSCSDCGAVRDDVGLALDACECGSTRWSRPNPLFDHDMTRRACSVCTHIRPEPTDDD